MINEDLTEELCIVGMEELSMMMDIIYQMTKEGILERIE